MKESSNHELRSCFLILKFRSKNTDDKAGGKLGIEYHHKINAPTIALLLLLLLY